MRIKIKVVLLTLSLICLLALISIGTWIWSLNSEIEEKLANRRFLPPTEFFSAPKTYSVTEKYTRDQIRQELLRREYREVPSDRQLATGQFWTLDLEDCKQRIGLDKINFENPICLILSPKQTPDPVFSTPPLRLQALVWGAENNQILLAFQGQPLHESKQIWLEPEVFAQYLGQTPVLQSWTSLGETPATCLNAVLAIEDANFLEHNGVSFLGIARATLKNILYGRAAQGGSTITQQMVKNFFLTPEKTLKRKATEIIMSILLEMHAKKDEIFETYLNIIYMGQSGPFEVRGFGAAAKHYFHRDLAQLQLSECSLLAAILNSPGNFDPVRKPENALKRRARVLEKMVEQKLITDSEAKAANAEGLPTLSPQKLWETAPYYIQAALSELNKTGVSAEGLQIFTGLVVSHQEAAQKAIQNRIQKLEAENPKIQKIANRGIPLEGLFLSLDLENNWMTAAVGGRSFRKTQYNRILESHRQIGSLIKPFVYYTALEQNSELGPLSIVRDEKMTIRYEGQSWTPENYGKKYEGEIPLYAGLKKSLNAATVKIGMDAGLENLISNLRKAGVSSPLSPLPSLTLGSFELYPTEVLQAYSTLAHFGKMIKPIWIRSARYPDGEVVFTNNSKLEQTLNLQTSAQVVSMMKQTVQSGTAQAIHSSGFLLPAAGKTGTTSDSRDAWFSGFTQDTLALAWIGYDQNESHNLTGASGPVPVWIDFMKSISNTKSAAVDFSWPEGTHTEKVQPEGEAEEIELLFRN